MRLHIDGGSRAPHRWAAFFRAGFVALFFALPFALLPHPAFAQEASVPTLRVGRLDGPIKLDGILDEPAWAHADSIPDLTMTEPVEGATPTGRTVVRVLANRQELVVGIVAYDPDPGGIVSFSKARDPYLRAEDHVIFVLDTNLDGRSGYTFAVNPTGARYDALISGVGERQIQRLQEVSLDVTQRLRASLLASLTVNTDFAETEEERPSPSGSGARCRAAREAPTWASWPSTPTLWRGWRPAQTWPWPGSSRTSCGNPRWDSLQPPVTLWGAGEPGRAGWTSRTGPPNSGRTRT
ncbi:MAG: hypothetical protein ACE5GJ_06940 [Gemmatimonadota bacterium]